MQSGAFLRMFEVFLQTASIDGSNFAQSVMRSALSDNQVRGAGVGGVAGRGARAPTAQLRPPPHPHPPPPPPPPPHTRPPRTSCLSDTHSHAPRAARPRPPPPQFATWRWVDVFGATAKLLNTTEELAYLPSIARFVRSVAPLVTAPDEATRRELALNGTSTVGAWLYRWVGGGGLVGWVGVPPGQGRARVVGAGRVGGWVRPVPCWLLPSPRRTCSRRSQPPPTHIHSTLHTPQAALPLGLPRRPHTDPHPHTHSTHPLAGPSTPGSPPTTLGS